MRKNENFRFLTYILFCVTVSFLQEKISEDLHIVRFWLDVKFTIRGGLIQEWRVEKTT
jgi:hypothetical protein